MERAAVGEHEIQGGESSVFLDRQVAHCGGRLRNRVVIAAPQPFEEEFEYQLGVDFPSVSKVVHERPVVLERPSPPSRSTMNGWENFWAASPPTLARRRWPMTMSDCPAARSMLSFAIFQAVP